MVVTSHWWTSSPGLLAALDELVHPETRGNPMSLLRWTTKSSTNLAGELGRQGFEVSSRTVLRLLHRLGYSLQANAKVTEGRQHPDRDAQFRYLNDMAEGFIGDGQPVLSVDTKKSTWSGGSRGSDEMLDGPAGRGRRLLIGAVEPARSLAQGPPGPGIVALSTNRRLV